MTTGDRIKLLRKEKGISQQMLADSLFVTQQTIAGYELNTRQPETSMVIALAKYFQVSTDYLLGIVEERTPITEINPTDLTEDEKSLIELIRTYPEDVRRSITYVIKRLGPWK